VYIGGVEIKTSGSLGQKGWPTQKYLEKDGGEEEDYTFDY
jgi:hypothetical protein